MGTANIDYDTVARIQDMLRTHPVFAQATILTVAHRLATIRNSGLILVLDEGAIVESGEPELLIQQGGHFATMIEAAKIDESAVASTTTSTGKIGSESESESERKVSQEK